MKARVIQLKTDPQVFTETLAGRKSFEIRFNDRDYKVGDILLLKETRFSGYQMSRGELLVFTGRECFVEVTHVMAGGYGLAEGWVVMSTTVNKEQ